MRSTTRSSQGRAATSAVDVAYALGGGAAIYRDNPLQRHSRDLWLYEIYAQAAQRAGDAAAAHGALAEFYYLSGNLNAAVEQAELGVRSASAKAYERARLQARLRQFREEETRQ